ncbi:hypothetical protein BC939DRAFT_465038 [Gamsiella multidivaricata]|uniref:uncharacterized protein n=1 Tax=Gamsiella multidivaricata TaxID=101098 RepID=UPI0022208569|nr:uncharacterized protein BC939DRAFT_465038 [Gamsiella multidivaricata]KAG0364153.1 hypothetical protein BGZ54_007787 [Gamsiella multidivaricata]KAI7817703.1 hypothetical protein BC939DRAFT_465038 [Gamsiella multidivaricata]
MTLRQQTLPFQIRNPYRLDRPLFDPTEITQATIAEEVETARLQLQQRPLPQQPSMNMQLLEVACPFQNGTKRIKDHQKRSSLWNPDRYDSRQSAGIEGTLDNDSDSRTQHENYNYFGQSWFSQGHRQRAPVLIPSKQQPAQLSVPIVTVTHHIDTHSELTFERHVEWLTQTALWWDMPVVHLYPAPQSSLSLECVESAASKFSNWVNFVRIPAGEEGRLGPATSPARSPAPTRIKGSRTRKGPKRDSTWNKSPAGDSCDNGGMVTLSAQRISGPRAMPPAGSTTREVEPVIGYVFVGSAEEQAQYHQVFETMENLYPMIEIRYINSFLPQYQQSLQQQELMEDPCLHSLSWIHYWSAAKESQVLQSKIVNEVVRVRPMWVNSDNLHRNYTPAQPSALSSPPATLSDCPTFTLSTSPISTAPSVYIGSDKSEGQSLEESLRGIPSTVSIASLLDVEDSIMGEVDHFCDIQDSQQVDMKIQDPSDLKESSGRSILSRAQSSLDIHKDSVYAYKPFDRRCKKWGFPSLSSTDKKSGYRRSLSTPLLLHTKEGISNARNLRNMGMDTVDPCHSIDTNMSPPSLSPVSLTSPTSASSTSSTTSLTSVNPLGIGHRLAGLAQRLGVYKMKGSSMLVVDM